MNLWLEFIIYFKRTYPKLYSTRCFISLLEQVRVLQIELGGAMRIIFGLGCVLLVGGCDIIPRGAALQSEVLAVSQDPEVAPSFAVEAVARENLAIFHGWPAADLSHYHWIDRVDQPNTRTIRSGDMIRVTVWSTGENGLLTSLGQRNVTLPETRVSSSGRIFLPYIGDLNVSGMSPDRARERIQEAYSATVPSAQVQIEMVEGRAQTVSFVDGISAPGRYPLPDNDFTILELIAEGGGISQNLNNPQVRLHRGGRIFGISAERLLETPTSNTTLIGGDKVFVEADNRSFLSLGAAGTESIHDFPTDTVSALEALSIIGGVTDTRADAKGILILRRYPTGAVKVDRSGPDHSRTIFTIDLTTADGLFSADQFSIESGDLIYVTESPLTAANSIFALVGSIFGLSNALSGL